MSNPIISSKKIQLISDFNYFDLLPVKKYQQCNMRIPQTILLQKGYIRDWVFNSHKISNHPILKKKKQNMTPMAVAKTLCFKNGYSKQITGCTNIKQIRDTVQQLLKQQKDYDFVKDKKVIQVTTVSNEILVMTLIQFLDYASENKYLEQGFYQKWKIIQERVSFTKIDQHYRVQNVRNNHIIQSKCQKIISLNTTQAAIHSTEIEDDPYKNSSPNKNFQISETKNIEGYKFFDTFLNKKFFNMSQDFVEFIQKNLKCLVQSVTTKFVINKQREPYLIAVQNLNIKPAKKIVDMQQFKMAKQKGIIRVQEYLKCLRRYIQQNLDKIQVFNLNTPLSQRSRCKGKMCKIPLQEVVLPALYLVQQKLKIPIMSANSRVVSSQLRDSVRKRKRRVFQRLTQNGIIASNYELQQQSSQYESSGDNDQVGQINKAKTKQVLKICQNCFTFYFHVNRFFDLDFYGNLVEKKVVQLPQINDTFERRELQPSKSFSEKTISFINKYQIKKQRESYAKSIPKKTQLQQLAFKFVQGKQQIEQLQNKTEIKPSVLNTQENKHDEYSKNKNNTADFSGQTKKQMQFPSGKQNQKSVPKQQNKTKSLKKLPTSNLKMKIDPLQKQKLGIVQDSLANHADTKGNRLLALSKLSQSVKYQNKNERAKSKTMHNINANKQKQKRPQNHTQALQQVLKKIQLLPDSSKQQLIYYAKKYYKDNLPQPLDRRCYSSNYDSHLYQFMSISPIAIHPKRKIKRRPQMSLKRLSQLTDYPQIVSRSQFIFDTIIVNEQTTIPFCVMTTNMVNPDNVRKQQSYENIFIVNDIFDCFIEHISMVKELLEEDQIYNKRYILFNYVGQSHTIYNRSNIEGYSAAFNQVLDKLVYRLSGEKNQLNIINLQRDYFKFVGFGFGGFLLANYLGSYSISFANRINCVTLINSFSKVSPKYKEMLDSLLQLYQKQGEDPTVQSHTHLYYHKAINSTELTNQYMEQKSGLNPIRVQDYIYILKSVLHQYYQSQTNSFSLQSLYFDDQNQYPVSIIYGRANAIVAKEYSMRFLYHSNNKNKQIQNRVFVQIQGGHDLLNDNYQDIFRILTLESRK